MTQEAIPEVKTDVGNGSRGERGSDISSTLRLVLGLNIGALVAVGMAGIQLARGVASREDVALAEERVNTNILSIQTELARRETLSFRQADWNRERRTIDREHQYIEKQCENVDEKVKRLEIGMGHLRARMPGGLPEWNGDK